MRYTFPNIEILSDWVINLESIFNDLISVENEQNLLIEAYLL